MLCHVRGRDKVKEDLEASVISVMVCLENIKCCHRKLILTIETVLGAFFQIITSDHQCRGQQSLSGNGGCSGCRNYPNT